LNETAIKKLAIGTSSTTWEIDIDDDATIESPNGYLKYNFQSPRFTTYASGQSGIQIYRKVIDRTILSVGPVGYTTYVTKKNVSFPSGVKAYIATSVGTSDISLSEVSARNRRAVAYTSIWCIDAFS
jgi:hypothetical protein